jgi:hypothetical protein
MLLFWRIRYFDSRDSQFKDRDLLLETDSLDAVTKAAVETVYELKDGDRGRAMLRYRHLFTEWEGPREDLRNRLVRHGGLNGVFIHDYFEDENGKELSESQFAFALTGDPNAVVFPGWMKQHDIEYALAAPSPIEIAHVKLSDEQLEVLGYFVRDLRELLASAFFKEGTPGTISGAGRGGTYVLTTAASDEEIRSFVMIFRLLYMEGERANFLKAVAVFCAALQEHPVAKWIREIAAEYEGALDREAGAFPMLGQRKLAFSGKRLIDVFLYTKYAHQPLGQNEQRARQLQACLASVGGSQDLLTWHFLCQIWQCALHIRNAGVVIAQFYDRYCQVHGSTCDVVASMQTDHPGLGTLEKREAREGRILKEKAEDLAKDLWERAGQPEGGHSEYLKEALEKLKAATGKTGDGRRGQQG